MAGQAEGNALNEQEGGRAGLMKSCSCQKTQPTAALVGWWATVSNKGLMERPVIAM